MWILSKNNDYLVNSDNVRVFRIIGNVLMADDNVNLGEFGTQDEAAKELNNIYFALDDGQESYSVG